MVLKEVKVPTMVQNATLSHVILDCIYSLNHSEKDGMILKWYFNGKTIFQWIPPSKPKVDYTNFFTDMPNTVRSPCDPTRKLHMVDYEIPVSPCLLSEQKPLVVVWH